MGEVDNISSDQTADPTTNPVSRRIVPATPSADPSDNTRRAPAHHGPGASPARFFWVLITAGAVAVVYLLFVLYYSVNFMFWDEWTLVPIIRAALHSQLTLSLLWAQHNENRMLVPNLVIVGSALLHNYSSRTIILLSATLFIVSYGLLLATFRIYVGRSLTPLHALTLGVVWFSLEDTENSLWGFQLAWYMIVLLLLVLLFLLLKDWRHRNVVLVLAALSAVAASFSSLQGLLLWPIGLVCLAWGRPVSRRRYVECGIWLVLGALTTGIYFWNYNFNATGGGSSPAFALHHPVAAARFVLAALGDVVPTTTTDLMAHEVLGVVILVVAIFVVIRSVLERTSLTSTALPVALILFGTLFDGSVALGRLGFGVADALGTRYSMANLLVLTGIVAFAWAHIGSWREVRARVGRRGVILRVGTVLLAAFLVIQCVTSMNVGSDTASASHRSRILGARTVVNLDALPASQAQALVSVDVWGVPVSELSPYLQESQEDHLGVFAPGPYDHYRSLGPPHPPVTCSAISGNNNPGQQVMLSGCTVPTGGSGIASAPLSGQTVIHWSGGGSTEVTIHGRAPSAMTCPQGLSEVTLTGKAKTITYPGIHGGFWAALCRGPQGNLSLVPGTQMGF